MAPEAIRSAAPAIPYKDRRGSDAPLMLPTKVITWLPPSGFNGACNKMVSTARRQQAVIGRAGGSSDGEAADHQGDGGHQAGAGRGAAGLGVGRPAVPAAARRP